MEDPIRKPSYRKPSISRLSSLNENLQSISDNEDCAFETERSTKKVRKFSRKQSRSNIMLGALKKDLQEIEANPAIRKHRKSIQRIDSRENQVNRNLEVFNETVSRMSWPRDQQKRRRYSSFGGLTSRSRRKSSVSSVSSGEIVLTDRELRKITMMQTLQNMGVKFPKKRPQNVPQSPTMNEVEVMENMQLRKRHSLSTRMLEATKLVEKRRQPETLKPLDNIIREVTEVSEMVTASSSDEKKKGSRPSSNESQSSNVMRAVPRANFQPRHRASIAGTSVAMEGIGAFRKRIKRRKTRPIQKFKRLAKFLVVLLRSWRVHAQSVHEILLSFDNIDAVTNTSNSEVELLFDISEYKAAKEAKISNELKRILNKKPGTRTKDEVYYIQIALRNYKSIVEYPVHMQKMLAEKAWYESYDAKRIIVREGHVPMCFYFLLTGSGVVSAMDRKTNVRKTIMYLSRGDSFGEQAIMTRSLRQTTVISRDRIELLTISDTDFVDIFMSGGLRDPNDPFLRSLEFLKEWPVELLSDNPKKAIFSYFKRQTVLVADSQKNDWIFVVKSGSCSILKKLEPVAPKKSLTKAAKQRTWRENVVGAMDQDKSLSHNEQLALMCEEEIKRLEEKNANIHYYALPEINVATNAAYSQLRQEHDKIVNQNTITRALHDLESMNLDEEKMASVTGSKNELIPPPVQRRKMSLVDLSNLMLKTPFLKAPGHSASTERKNDSIVYPVTTTENEEDEEEEERPSTASTRKDLQDDDKEAEKAPIFVNVYTLTKGDVFGLQDVVFDNQTSLSLVSNGVEVIMIHKKFFTDQLNVSQFVRLREKIYPYPSEEKLKQDLTDRVSWDYQKKTAFLNALRNAAIRKQNIHDARSHLTIPPVVV
ncbi:uncharacterized protein LOC134728309 [Mytilus trossulus]|uniref:uncharacterized protein LOC134728309 n=1 Tax=Mytilus trossulus TaxID=6551 RepID=UPI003006CEAD